jgi:deoxyribonuclease V
VNFKTNRLTSQEFLKRFSKKFDSSSLDLDSLREEQMYLAKKIILKDKFDTPEILAGVDLSYEESNCIVAYVAIEYKTLEVLELNTMKVEVNFPYMPTFLAYREGPPILRVLERIDTHPDILMINGHGIAHPLFCGCASHIGVLTSIPTIGVAQKLLHGMSSEVPVDEGSYRYVDYKGKKVGAFFLSKYGCNPLIVSPGHLITLDSSLKIVKHSLKGYKLPEPLRLAHKFSQDEKRRI